MEEEGKGQKEGRIEGGRVECDWRRLERTFGRQRAWREGIVHGGSRMGVKCIGESRVNGRKASAWERSECMREGQSEWGMEKYMRG